METINWLLANSETINWVFTGVIITLLAMGTIATIVKIVRNK